MNILFRGFDSKNGYQSKLLKELDERIHFDHCTIISFDSDGNDDYVADKYSVIPSRCGYWRDYSEVCNIDDLPALDEDLLVALEPYKSVMLEMTGRYYAGHIFTFEDMDSDYFLHIRFWYSVLIKDKIDMCFFSVVPHFPWEYGIYALAKVLHIPTLVIIGGVMPGLNIVGTSIEKMGNNTGYYYQKGLDLKNDDRLETYCHEISNNNGKETGVFYISPKDRKRALLDKRKWEIKTFRRPAYDSLLYVKAIIKDILFLRKNRIREDIDVYNKMLYVVRRIRQEEKRKINYKRYNKQLCDSVNYNEKYIFYALHMWPEAVTLPRAGVFRRQLLAIRILAQAAERCGVKVYVKEHFVQYNRSKIYYDELENIPNVYLINTMVNTYYIMDNALAIAGINGTNIFEGIVRGIPVLTFADGYYSGAPGVQRVSSVKDTYDAIKRILNNQVEWSNKEAFRFVSIMSHTLIKSYLDYPDYSKVCFSKEECMHSIVDLIEKFIKFGLREDFMYIDISD